MAIPKRSAVDYIPSEKDVDPDTLAEGKGQQDTEARDMRDDNAGDRAGIHTSALVAGAKEAADLTRGGKVAALRNHQADTLTVLYEGRKVAHWEGAGLQAAINDGTLDPRRIEASAIEAARAAGMLTPAADPASFVKAVHAYLDKRASEAYTALTTEPVYAEPLDDPDWMEEITPQQVQRALREVDPTIGPKAAYPGIATGLADTLKRNPAPYTELSCVNLNSKPGEIQSYALGDEEIPLFADPEWQALEQHHGPELVQAHLASALDRYRGMLHFSATAAHLKLRAHDQPIYASLSMYGKRWVRTITAAGARKLIL